MIYYFNIQGIFFLLPGERARIKMTIQKALTLQDGLKGVPHNGSGGAKKFLTDSLSYTPVSSFSHACVGETRSIFWKPLTILSAVSPTSVQALLFERLLLDHRF